MGGEIVAVTGSQSPALLSSARRSVLDRATAPQSSALRNPDTRWGSRGDLRPLMGAENVPPREPHPFRIHALHPGIRQSVAERSVDAGAVVTDGAGKFDERGESTAPGPLQPGVEQRDPFGALELKHLPKLLLEQVRAIERRVGLGDPGEGAGLTVGEIAGVLPQSEAGVLQLLRHRLLPALAGRVPHLTSDLVERLGRPGHDMKRVQAQLGVLATLSYTHLT